MENPSIKTSRFSKGFNCGEMTKNKIQYFGYCCLDAHMTISKFMDLFLLFIFLPYHGLFKCHWGLIIWLKWFRGVASCGSLL